jgi:hypothetical protein
MDNSIEIDGILFTLLSKSVADNLVYEINKKTRDLHYDNYRAAGRIPFIENDRDIVKFTSKSSEGEKILYGYRSTSELGVWRLGYLEARFCDLNKFTLDYVQGTLLHVLLQKLINENFHKLPFITEDESGTKLVVNALPQFAGKLPPGNINLTQEQINDVAFLETHKFILLPFSTPADTAFIDNPERKIQLQPFSSIPIKCDNKIEETDIRSQLSLLSSNIESEYELDVTSNQHIVTYPFQEPNENIWNCVISMYTVNLINRVSLENNVILVYCKYQLEYSPEHIPVSGCYGIALLKSDKSAVNKYGLYESFIDAGIYICKPIVYARVCVVAEEELEKRRCSKRYVYVGDRYDHIFPYGELYHMLASGGLRKPRFKRKYKKSKKIKKSKFLRKSKKIRKSKVLRKSKK